MRKLLLLAVLICGTIFDAQASDKKGILYMQTPAYYEVKNLSRNGQWACGIKYDPDTDLSYGFRWNLTTNHIEMLGGVCQANCIADDGTVAGSFYTSQGISSGKSIEVPALWQNGEWQILELPNEIGSWASAISPDGRFVTGDDNNYTAYVWTDGQITSSIPVEEYGKCNMAYSISPDGKMLGGWAYAHDEDVRNAGYWTVSDKTFHDLEPNTQGAPWQAVKRFSADSKKMLYWGGYHEDGEGRWGLHAIYDTATQDTITIYPVEDDPFNIDFYDMNADGTVVTGYEENGDGEQYGLVWHDGETETVETYLESRGANFENFDIIGGAVQDFCLIGVPGVDDAANTFALYYYDSSYSYHSMVVAFDRDISMTPPNNLKAEQVAGLRTVSLSWDEPLGDKSTLLGYNIYRNGEKITSEPVTKTSYYDTRLMGIDFLYKVTAQYEEGESATGTEAFVSLTSEKIMPPTSLVTRQKGYNSLLSMWSAPESNLPSLNYYGDESTQMDGFGGASVSFESGTLFPVDMMNLYEGYSVAGVTFYPACEQNSWIVNLYTHKDGKLTRLYSYTVDQTLKYGEKNTVKFPEPVALESGQDLLVGVQTNVVNSSYDVQKVYEDCLKIGYTDLIRQVGESDFYSINEMSEGDTWNVAWATGVLMSSPSTPADIDDLDWYSVTLNYEEVKLANDETFEMKSLEDGEYKLGVQAVYKNGNRSDIVESDFVMKANREALKSITPEVSTVWGSVVAKWDAPLDDDSTTIRYCGTTPASVCPMTNEDVVNIAARVDFLPADLRTYQGYQIKSLDFYPLSDATFTLQIYEGENLLQEIPVDEPYLGEWNTIPLKEPVDIHQAQTYVYVIYCDDCPVDKAPLAIDDEATVDNACFLLVDGADEWSTIEDESYLSGNWLMRINVAEADAAPLEVDSYDVYVDNGIVSSQQSLAFSHIMANTQGLHSVRVDTRYAVSSVPVEGEEVWFQFDPTGIDLTPALSQGEGAMYNVLGQRVNENAKGIIIKGGKKVIK